MAGWVNFKQLREQIDVAAMLAHYKVVVKHKGSQAIGFCPLPKHQGNRKSPSFSVSFEKRIFQCFGCGAKGNILELGAILQGLNPENSGDLRKAALELQRLFVAPTAADTTNPPPHKESPSPVSKDNVIINAPLDFELKRLDENCDYLRSRGFTLETTRHFGLGYCSKGLMSGRIAIPLHDSESRLIGYAGRIVFDEAIDEENPKYLFPSRREREGKVYEFAKSLFVYNGHRIAKPVDDAIVVEGFPATWWLHQHGYRNVVALMGSSCSDDQAKIITRMVTPGGRIWLLPDLDEAGVRCAQSALMQLAPQRFCRWVKPVTGPQPTDCSAEELATLLPNLKCS